MNKKILVLVLAMLIIMMFSTFVYANDTVTDTLNQIRDGGDGDVIGNEVKDKFTAFGADLTDIIMIVITTWVIIKGIILIGRFTGEEDSRAKTEIKSKLMYHVGGLILIANYFGLFEFLFTKFNKLF